MSIYRNLANNTNKHYFGKFYYGLLCGLIFGFVISALIAWVISSKNIPKSNQTDDRELTELIENNQNIIATPSFDFYEKGIFNELTNNQLDPEPVEVSIENVIEGSLNQDRNISSNNINNNSQSPEIRTEVIKDTQIALLKTENYDKIEKLDELKAQLALIGYVPAIVQSNNGFYMQLGPYKNKKEAHKRKIELGTLGNNFSIE